MFSKIILPLDGSKLAERAIPHARRIARTFDSEIRLMQVLDSSPYHDLPQVTEPLNWQIRKAQADLYLQGLSAELREEGLRADYAIREGKTAENIIDYAHSEGADLLVLTTHGASGLSRWNTSSVVQKVIEKIYLPVMLVRAYQTVEGQRSPIPDTGGAQGIDRLNDPTALPSASEIGRQSALEWGSEALYRRILLPIDTSRRAECALSPAISLTREAGLLILAAVIAPPELPIPAPYPEEINVLIDRFMQASREAVNLYLDDQRRRLDVPVEVRTIENTNPSAALHHLAEKENVDLVVLCAHGRTGGTEWPYGSVARNYIEHGDRTVLIIQDIPRAQVRPTMVETAAEKYGRR